MLEMRTKKVAITRRGGSHLEQENSIITGKMWMKMGLLWLKRKLRRMSSNTEVEVAEAREVTEEVIEVEAIEVEEREAEETEEEEIEEIGQEEEEKVEAREVVEMNSTNSTEGESR